MAPANNVNVATLTEIAKLLAIQGVTKMKKAELVDAIVTKLQPVVEEVKPVVETVAKAVKKEVKPLLTADTKKKINYYVFKTDKAAALGNDAGFRDTAYAMSDIWQPIYAGGMFFEKDMDRFGKERNWNVAHHMYTLTRDKNIVVFKCNAPYNAHTVIMEDIKCLSEKMGVKTIKIDIDIENTVAVCTTV